jgi:hypothetical protein
LAGRRSTENSEEPNRLKTANSPDSRRKEALTEFTIYDLRVSRDDNGARKSHLENLEPPPAN